ncbi:hypothetical protein HAX44_13260 [Enterococcus faecalis]|uniref:Type VII secretion effector n=2 Tax=Enterococcus faecalis TaxID=1351 RepID=R3KE29_ENTFL|nr:hypothetical protein [Enterococcus faecalis]BDH66524.1 hypothetical protein MTP05_27090 [Enterococcus sp. PLM3]EOK06759.1 hypothetical protein WOU_03132 [Enterococcus faecalis ATCC 6055]MBF0006579.1 hypothetical protein [Enterococcus faecalis]MBF0009262.1 hypothetical protein [Enterococcus faecalis]MBF0018443.1 hypothetical protein [Enterococcus faecalis]
MGKVVSNSEAAGAAITGVTSVSINKGQQTSLGESTVSGLKTGVEISNQLLTNLEQLITCVKAQSEKFPKLAEVIGARDMSTKF